MHEGLNRSLLCRHIMKHAKSPIIIYKRHWDAKSKKQTLLRLYKLLQHMHTITDHNFDHLLELIMNGNNIIFILQVSKCEIWLDMLSDNNEMPLDCAGESMKINLSLSLIWSRETKLHFLHHRPCCGYFVWIHGRVTLEWID